MDVFITHTLSIKNHPICKLKEHFKTQYVLGLAEFMCYMSKRDSRSSLVFKVWAGSILSPLPKKCWQCTADYSKIRKAVSLKRDGFRFFTMRRAFFFDCFYLVSKIDTKLIEEAYSFLYEHVKDIIARRKLLDVYNNWEKDTLAKIPSQLIKHQKTDNEFHKKNLKKILVVATMSAGKSTLINALMGYRVNEVRATACTSKLCYLYNKPVADGVIAKLSDGRYKYRYNIDTLEKGEADEIALHFNSTLGDKHICLIDTPGTNYSDDKSHGEITRKAIASNIYDAIIFVVNSLQFNTDDEASLREFVFHHTKKPIIFVLNQLDFYNPEDDSIQETIRKLSAIVKKKDESPFIIPLSAYYALLLKIGENKLGKQEQMQFNHLKNLFKHDYYNMASYYFGSQFHPRINNELLKTGITILENVIKQI